MTPRPAFALARRWVLRAALAVVLVAVLASGFHWWSTHWRPARSDWPVQGAAVGPANLPVSWPGLQTQGVSFAYIDAVVAGIRSQPSYTSESAAARAAGLRVGAIHHFSVCRLASDQAAAFVRLVPRDDAALPTAITLDTDDSCPHPPTRALMLSELTTFINQIETHMGKAVIIAPSPEFEARYAVDTAINRALWVRRNWRAPAADSPAWVIWQANDALRVTGSVGPTRWLVLHDGGPDGISPEGPTP